MANPLGAQFDMRPNIKNKPGSQGVLFRAKTGQRQPWPRGYTPERLQEVRAATQGRGLDPQTTYPPRAEATARMRDNVARSTVPAEHLTKVSFYPESQALVREHGALEAAGRYRGPRERRGNQIHIAPGFAEDNTVIHEIGHHVSAVHEGREHSAYAHPAQMGQEEGFAENYADEHFRDRRGTAVQTPRLHGDAWVTGGARGGHAGDFLPAYRAERSTSPAVQWYKASLDAGPTPPKSLVDEGLPERSPGQISLLDKTGRNGYHDGTTYHTEESVDWDYKKEYDRDEGIGHGLKRETVSPTTRADLQRRRGVVL